MVINATFKIKHSKIERYARKRIKHKCSMWKENSVSRDHCFASIQFNSILFRYKIRHTCKYNNSYVTGSDILSLMEPKIGNFVFHIFMYISVFTADFQKHNEFAPRITAKNSKIHTNPIFYLRCLNFHYSGSWHLFSLI